MKSIFTGLLALFVTSAVFATDAEDNIREAMTKMAPDLKIDSIELSPIAGLYEVIFGANVIYLSADGKYIVQGSIIETATRKNITEVAKGKGRASILADLKDENMVVFAPEEVKHTVTVFTDIDCGYCRKLHDEVAKYNELGIKIRYAAYPRAGIGSASFAKAEAVWCSDDRESAMTQAKSGKAVDSTIEKDCASHVQDQYKMARALDLSGTPALFLESGELVPGYVAAERLIEQLER